MAIHLRPLALDDVEAIVALLVAVHGEMSADEADGFRHDAVEQARGEVPDSITYVICDGVVRVGRLRVVRVDGCVEIAGLQIHPAWQNRGIGTEVIRDVLAEGRRARAVVELDVAKDNPDAERLYTRLGFARVGEAGRDYRMRHRG